MSRYTTSRAQHGSPIVVDQVERRPVLVAMRNTDQDQQAADAAAMRMVAVCAQALNDVERATVWGKS